MMRFLLLLFFSLPVLAKEIPVKFEFDAVPVAQVVRVIYSEALKTPYVLSPDLLADVRPVSFRYDNSRGPVRSFLVDFLGSLNYQVERLGGVDFVRQKLPGAAKEVDKAVFVYRPKYRDGSYLSDLVGSLFSGQFTIKRTIAAAPGDVSKGSVPPGSAAALVDRSSDTLIFQGSEIEIAQLKKLLAQVDVPSGDVVVKGVLYEVQTGADDASAFALAASILDGKLGVSIGAPASLASGSLSFSGVNFSAVITALASDSRFKIVSSPSARVRSGSMSRFTVGQDVPVLGELLYPEGGGVAVQSVKYQSSGVIFQVTPTVRDSVVDVDVSQQLSSFVNTTTGVNASPTLTKRQMDTSVSIGDGDVIVLGGLTENKDSAGSSGLSFLPGWMRTKNGSTSKTEILLFLQVNKI